VQSAAGKVSRSRTALKRWTNTEARWNKKLASLASPELAEILFPSSFKRRRAEQLKTPRVSTAIGSKTYNTGRKPGNGLRP